MKIIKYIACIWIALVAVTACDLIKKEPQKEVVARVGQDFLYKDELTALVPKGISSADSALVVNNYINSWATKRLLMTNAQKNLDAEKVQEFEVLVSDYKTDLYTKTYLETLVLRSLDTVIDDAQLEKYYELNNENFKLNEEVLKLRFISVPKNNDKIRSLKEKLKRFNEEDYQYLDSLSYQYTNYMFNDSVWVKSSEVQKKIAPITPENLSDYLKKSQFYQLEDSLGVYLVQINDYKKRNEAAPLSFIKPTIRQIILNQRKLQFIKKLKKDILDDAIQNKQFETYEGEYNE